jgi:hypothetical protein
VASQQTSKTQRGEYRKNQRWRARVKHDGREFYIGTFDTKEEAEAEEQAFRDEVKGG